MTALFISLGKWTLGRVSPRIHLALFALYRISADSLDADGWAVGGA